MVLLIEDDLMNIEAMRRLMLQFNLELSWATSGSVALQMIQSRLDKADDPTNPAYMYRLILCDYSMPGMNGLQTTQQIHQLLTNAPNNPPMPLLCCVTAYSAPNFRKKALEGGFDDFITKPVFKDRLQAVIIEARIPL